MHPRLAIIRIWRDIAPPPICPTLQIYQRHHPATTPPTPTNFPTWQLNNQKLPSPGSGGLQNALQTAPPTTLLLLHPATPPSTLPTPTLRTALEVANALQQAELPSTTTILLFLGPSPPSKTPSDHLALYNAHVAYDGPAALQLYHAYLRQHLPSIPPIWHGALHRTHAASLPGFELAVTKSASVPSALVTAVGEGRVATVLAAARALPNMGAYVAAGGVVSVRLSTEATVETAAFWNAWVMEAVSLLVAVGEVRLWCFWVGGECFGVVVGRLVGVADVAGFGVGRVRGVMEVGEMLGKLPVFEVGVDGLVGVGGDGRIKEGLCRFVHSPRPIETVSAPDRELLRSFAAQLTPVVVPDVSRGNILCAEKPSVGHFASIPAQVSTVDDQLASVRTMDLRSVPTLNTLSQKSRERDRSNLVLRRSRFARLQSLREANQSTRSKSYHNSNTLSSSAPPRKRSRVSDHATTRRKHASLSGIHYFETASRTVRKSLEDADPFFQYLPNNPASRATFFSSGVSTASSKGIKFQPDRHPSFQYRVRVTDEESKRVHGVEYAHDNDVRDRHIIELERIVAKSGLDWSRSHVRPDALAKLKHAVEQLKVEGVKQRSSSSPRQHCPQNFEANALEQGVTTVASIPVAATVPAVNLGRDRHCVDVDTMSFAQTMSAAKNGQLPDEMRLALLAVLQ